MQIYIQVFSKLTASQCSPSWSCILAADVQHTVAFQLSGDSIHSV